MKTEQRRRLLRVLFRRCKGRCTNCNVEVGLGFELIKNGWEIYDREGLVVSPRGQIVFLATIEHLNPKGKGGSNNINNLTLYCAHCNRKTSHFGMPVKQEETVAEKSLWDRVMQGVVVETIDRNVVDEDFWLKPLESCENT